MARGPATFKQADVTRALKGAKAAGIEVARIEVEKDGKIVVVIGKAAEPNQATDFDNWKSRHAHSA